MAQSRPRRFARPWTSAAGALAIAALSVPAPGAEGFSLGGYIEGHVAARLGDVTCPAGTACRLAASDLRARLKVEGSTAGGAAAFSGQFDLARDAVLATTTGKAREFYGDLVAEKAALRVGRQVITWGVGDLLFINDTFPKDWSAFFTGQPLEYLKLGSDAAKASLFPGPFNLELVVAEFRPDALPDRRRFVFDDPLPAGPSRLLVEPHSDPGGLEVSGKIYGYWDNWELAGYAARTHFRSPAYRFGATEIVGRYPRLHTYGASLGGSFGKSVLTLEAGYYDSREDRSGTDPSVENSQLRALVGYSRQLVEDTTLGVQLYAERMSDYGAYVAALPAGFPRKERLRTIATVRFTQLYRHQTVILNVFAFLGLSSSDRLIIPSVRYAVTDNFWVEAGANFFGGSGGGMFGALKDNDNLYVTLRYAF
ncbi:MAG: hypothetical protein HY323_08845 [Betaproteobacteria bacterium]|nr:hypothetical protein [Betaproteobacteria bacterium]